MKRGNFSFVNTDALFSLFGFDFRLGFPIISAGNMNYLSQMVTFSAYLALGNHNLKEQIQDLIHGEGGQQPLPEAIKEIMDILINDISKVMEAHLRDGYLTYSDFAFSAILTDIMCSAIDLVQRIVSVVTDN